MIERMKLAMTAFFAALAIFLASHSIPAVPRVRSGLVRAIGERTYLIIYGTISIDLLGWLIAAAQRAPYLPLWSPALWQYWIPLSVMPVALFLLIGGITCPNPLSVGFRARCFDGARPGIVGITRHPILWGFALWAGSHMVPNGDVVSVVMFGGFAVFALAAIPMIDRRKQRQMGEQAWTTLAKRTTALPFAGLIEPGHPWLWPSHRLAMTLALTLVTYGFALELHAWLFGPDPTIAFS